MSDRQNGVTQTKFTTWAVFALFGLALVALVFVINGRFNAGAHRRHDICVQINAIKKILQDEHIPKLHKAQESLRRWPNGVTLTTSAGPVRVTHQDLLESRNDELRIVRATKQEVCP